MTSGRFAATALASFVVAILAAAPVATAQDVGGTAGGGLTFQQAQRKFPGLRQVTFEKADLNGDGVIEPNELPILQGIYQQTTQSR